MRVGDLARRAGGARPERRWMSQSALLAPLRACLETRFKALSLMTEPTGPMILAGNARLNCDLHSCTTTIRTGAICRV
jgi:hypothetical protein